MNKYKTMNILGDSITWGYNPNTGEQIEKNYSILLKERLNLKELRNYGINSSTLADNKISYEPMCNNNKQIIQTFLNEMEEIIQEESNESSIKRLEEEKQILKEKIDKLIDLNLNGTITLETLQEKKAKLQNKINQIKKDKSIYN